MSYTDKIMSLAVLAAALSGCEFNEDSCVRNGELLAWCDFEGISVPPPIAEQRHLAAYTRGTDIPGVFRTDFTQDTLRWSIPQGGYRFLFYTGDYERYGGNDYHEARLQARTDTLEGQAYISGVQGFCCTALLDERLEYQNPKTVRITPSAFVQRLNILINVSGNTGPLSSLHGTLSGIRTGRYLASRERTGNASATGMFARKDGTDGWRMSLYAFGFTPTAENRLTVRVEMDGDDSLFNEEQSVDLTPYLRGFDGDELSLELNLHIGKELTIEDPVVIPGWEDIPETELPNFY